MREMIFLMMGLVVMIPFSTVQGVPILAKWTFETSVPANAGPHAAEEGSGSATGYHTSTSVVYSNPVGNGSAESFSSNYWTTVGDYYQFQTSSTGYTGIEIKFDQTRSSTGPSDFEVWCSTDGTNWTTMTGYTVPAIGWSSSTPDATGTTTFGPYTAPAALDNQSTIYFRLNLKTAVTATGGTSRVDNVTITPEPATLVALGAASILCLLRIRNRKV